MMSRKIDRHRLVAEAPRGEEALVAADDGLVLAPGEDRLDEAELAEAAGQRFELSVADPTGIGGVRSQVLDRDLLDGMRQRGDSHRHRLKWWGG